MAISSEELREKGAQLATRLVEWLEHEGLAARLVDSYRALAPDSALGEIPSSQKQFRRIVQEALLAMAGFFLVRSSFQFRKKHLWFFRRPDWEALAATWEGFSGELRVHLDDEQKEYLDELEITWPAAGMPTTPFHSRFAERLGRALDPRRPEQAGRAAEKLLPVIERAVNHLTDEIFGR